MPSAARKIEPQGEWLSIMQIAKRCGIHRQTCISRLGDLGFEPDAERRSTANHHVYWFDTEVEFAIKAARDTASAMKIRDLRAAAQTKEFKLAVMRDEYVLVSETVEIAQRIVGAIFQELKTRQPKRISPKLARAKNVTAVNKILKTDHDRILKSLRGDFERFIA